MLPRISIEYVNGKPRRTGANSSWHNMRQRCQNPNNPKYPLYGGRGIAVCERWQTFKNFLEDMGNRPEGMSIDRIDSDGNYEPGNCRWATNKRQSNNLRKNLVITYAGQTMTASEWARHLGLHPQTLYSRLSIGWPLERALQRHA